MFYVLAAGFVVSPPAEDSGPGSELPEALVFSLSLCETFRGLGWGIARECVENGFLEDFEALLPHHMTCNPAGQDPDEAFVASSIWDLDHEMAVVSNNGQLVDFDEVLLRGDPDQSFDLVFVPGV